MKRVLIAIFVFIPILIQASCGAPAGGGVTKPIEKMIDVAWKCSTKDKQWQDCDNLELVPGAAGTADISIDTSKLGQQVEGFGGCFNEKGWEALSLLSEQERDAVIKALFDPAEGAKFNICRVPIGANDYALSRYTLDETEGDYDMKDFSIERDREYLIPYIKAAMGARPDLKVWGSAWTPPTWMKTSGSYDGGSMKDDPQVYNAYALYLARFVEDYQAEGIDLFAVAVQNEPGIERNYPTCLWEKEQFGTFIKEYMGPLFQERGVSAKIMLGTLEDGDFGRYPSLLYDPDIDKYVSMVGYQWGGLYAVASTRSDFPDKSIYQTETECGNFYWKEGYMPDRPPNDWAYGIYTWSKIKEYFNEGVGAYMLWNMVLDEEGLSIDSGSPWPQNAAITVDSETNEVTYTPMFYAFKHFSFFVEPGARYVDIDAGTVDAIAFLNPDGTLVLELQNESSQPRVVTINIDGGTLKAELPGVSWSTLTVLSTDAS